MTILAFDQSSRVSGYSVFQDNKLLTFGKFSFDDQDMGTRLTQIRSKVKSLIEEYQPDHVVFEDIQQQNNVANNVQTFKILAEVYGVISELLSSLHIPYSTILAASWKSTLGIKGRTRQDQKHNAQTYVQETYGVKCTQDEADSICIGTAHIKKSACAWTD